MASNKNQHFVPRCYLRPFTINDAGVAINLYNIDRRKLICSAPVKSQCSGDYFYGKNDRLEKAIQHIESEYATAIRLIQEPHYELTSDHRTLLAIFWLFQHIRTEAASRRTVEMNEGLHEPFEQAMPGFRLGIREAVQLAMQTFGEIMDTTTDLKVCLLRNRTRIPFVTSDDPAILCNRWSQWDARTREESFGMQAAGDITLLPLSPKVLCLGYDGDVYSVPNDRGWVEVRNQSDIEALNEHQFLNCRANIFVKDPNDFDAIQQAYLKAESLRPAQRHLIIYAAYAGCDDTGEFFVPLAPAEAKNHAKALIHTKTVYAVPSRWPTFLTWRSGGTVYTNGTRAGYLRRRYAVAGPGPAFWKERARAR